MIAWEKVAAEVLSLIATEPDEVANMANVAAHLFHALNESLGGAVNWLGFYRVAAGEATLVLGPFQGRVACIRIPFGAGVCGTAAASRATVLVPDVDAFPGHISCDSASKSEVVVPVFDSADALIGVLDVDANVLACFDAADAAGLELCMAAFRRPTPPTPSQRSIKHAH